MPTLEIRYPYHFTFHSTQKLPWRKHISTKCYICFLSFSSLHHITVKKNERQKKFLTFLHTITTSHEINHFHKVCPAWNLTRLSCYAKNWLTKHSFFPLFFPFFLLHFLLNIHNHSGTSLGTKYPWYKLHSPFLVDKRDAKQAKLQARWCKQVAGCSLLFFQLLHHHFSFLTSVPSLPFTLATAEQGGWWGVRGTVSRRRNSAPTCTVGQSSWAVIFELL